MLKMVKRKTKRNARRPKAHGSFKIHREPHVHLRADASSRDVGASIGLRHEHWKPFLFAIARDAGTIFASWNIDWQRVFQGTTPADRQVYLRLIGDDGVERKRVAVEPMTAVHYVTISALAECSRVEIGYFQPIDTWNSVAISNKIEIPPQGMADIGDVDLAMIPFHLSFDQLTKLIGAPKNAPLARVISQFQKRIIIEQPDHAAPADAQIVRKLNYSRADIAGAHRDFQKINTEKLARRTRAILQSIASSPVRGFEGNSG
jgi:Domain of unknown function (DUF4912)